MRDQREFRLHCAVMDLLRLSAQRDVVFLHPANGEARSAITGARLKRMGVLPGTGDVLLILPPGGMAAFLELKAGKGRQTEAQKLFQQRCERAGALYAVAGSFDEAQAILSQWGALRTHGKPAVQLPLKGMAALRQAQDRL